MVPEPEKKPTEMTIREVALMVDAAVGVIGGQGDSSTLLSEAKEMPPRILVRRLEEAIAACGFSAHQAALVADASTNPSTSPELAAAVISALKTDDSLAIEMSDVFGKRQDLMAIDPATVGLGVLLLIVLRTKRVRVGKEGLEIDLEPIKSSIVHAVLSLLEA